MHVERPRPLVILVGGGTSAVQGLGLWSAPIALSPSGFAPAGASVATSFRPRPSSTSSLQPARG
jgi:hypothetical protein